MNYCVYDSKGNLRTRCNTQTEGETWIKSEVQKWRELGRKGHYFRLCYNGRESVEVFRMES